MSTTRFFRFALLLPLIFACIVAVVVSPLAVISPLYLGGLPYLLVTVPAYFAIGRAKTMERLVMISVLMPVAMFLLLTPLSVGLGGMGLLIVAAFVAVAWLLYGISRKAGWVLAMPPNNSLERTREG
jgi:hypothetical protein